jgi:hypothetical protein
VGGEVSCQSLTVALGGACFWTQISSIVDRHGIDWVAFSVW